MKKAIILDPSFVRHLGNFREVKSAIQKQEVGILLAMGTKQQKELRKEFLNTHLGDKRYAEYYKLKHFTLVCPKSVEKMHGELKRLKKNTHTRNKIIESNDPHVLALAIVTGANVLVAEDKYLVKDYKNCKKINRKSHGVRNKKLGSSDDLYVISKSDWTKDVSRVGIPNILSQAAVPLYSCACIGGDWPE